MKKLKISLLFLCLIVAIYGAGRLYFYVTGGFRIAHISSDFIPDPQWDTRALSDLEWQEVRKAVDQPFSYLGKGCQSYVFLSEDGGYVVKFFKYQRFRPHPILTQLSFLPPVEKLVKEKKEKKKIKLDALYSSWKLAFDHFPSHTGLIYVHLNKTKNLFSHPVTFYDKIGRGHTLELDGMEFLIQKKAIMLCDELDLLMAEGKEKNAQELITSLFDQVVLEYHKGFADNDHALMQNTGVIDHIPVHIDVGQFVQNESMKDPTIYWQELYNKFYKFRLWLKEKHPSLLLHVDQLFYNEMGDAFFTTKHIPKIH